MKIIIPTNENTPKQDLNSLESDEEDNVKPNLEIKLEGLLMIKGQNATIQHIKERVARETGQEVGSRVAIIENVSYDDTHPVRNLNDNATLFLIDRKEIEMQVHRRKNDGVIASMIDQQRKDNLNQGLVMDLAKNNAVYTHTAMRRYIKFVKIADHLFAMTVKERWRQYLPLRIIGALFWSLQLSAFVVRRGYLLIGSLIILVLYCIVFAAIYITIHRRLVSTLSTPERFVPPPLAKSIPSVAWWQYTWLALRIFVFVLIYAAFVGALQKWKDTSVGFRFAFWVVSILGYNLCLNFESWVISAHQTLKYYKKYFILPPPCFHYDEVKITTPINQPTRISFEDVEEVFVAVNREMFNFSLASAFQPSERVENVQPNNVENPAFVEPAKNNSHSKEKKAHKPSKLKRGQTENAIRVVDLENNESRIFKDDPTDDINDSSYTPSDDESVLRLASNEERVHWLCFRCKGTETNPFTIYGVAVKPPRPCLKFELAVVKPNARDTGVHRKHLIRLLGVLASCKEQLRVQIEVMQSVLKDL